MQKKIRLHPPLVKAIESGLNAILCEGMPADKFMLSIGRNKKFGSRDRRFIGKHLYDILRYKRLVQFIAGSSDDETPNYRHWLLINIIRTGLETDQALDMAPEEEKLAVEWKQKMTDEETKPSVNLSFPEWMWDIGSSEFGDDWQDLATSLNVIPPIYLRVNTLKTSVYNLQKAFEQSELGIRVVEDSHAFELLERKKLANHNLYKKGYFEFQDLASQHVGIMADVVPGMTVVDACAGAGGKTLHLAALMKNRGILYCADKYPRRMEQLTYRYKRAGVKIVRRVEMDSLTELAGKADRVILDAPCSATGTIGRKPEIKWRVTHKDLKRIIDVQKEILETNCMLVKPGGKLIFATCSVFKCEGEERVAEFLSGHSEFELAAERRFYPAVDRSDGFYIAVMNRLS